MLDESVGGGGSKRENPLAGCGKVYRPKVRTFEEYVYETGGAHQHLAGDRVDVRLSNSTL